MTSQSWKQGSKNWTKLRGENTEMLRTIAGTLIVVSIILMLGAAGGLEQGDIEMNRCIAVSAISLVGLAAGVALGNAGDRHE